MYPATAITFGTGISASIIGGIGGITVIPAILLVTLGALATYGVAWFKERE